MKNELDKILKRVEKPARYIGMEKNSIKKNLDNIDIKFAFAFPDTYEIAMSNLGMQILYNLLNTREDIACERVFSPAVDMESELRNRDIELFTLENKLSIREFDFIGFTLQYELSYTNIINILDLGNIPIFSKDRDESFPIIIAGGPCVYNPEPLADIIDLFVIGEGEEIILELMDLYKLAKNKEEFLYRALDIEGIYVPKYYEIEYNSDGTISKRISLDENAKDIITKRIVKNIEEVYYPDKVLVPFINIVHDKMPLEMFRGCTHGCRFCQAGMIYRPVRERSKDRLVEITENIITNSGHEGINLSSLSSCDYSQLKLLIHELMERYSEKNIKVSLPSLRIDSFSLETLEEIEESKRSGVTFAPEAGTQRLRNVINKGIEYEQLIETIKLAFKGGWSGIKLYFMIGLPTETYKDVLGIKDIGYEVRHLFFSQDRENQKGNFKVTLSTGCFVPKAFTPFQWEGQTSLDDFYKKINLLKANIFDEKIIFDYSRPEMSIIEGIIARGDRKVGNLIVEAWKNGSKFDGWTDYFNYTNWLESAKNIGLNIDFYTERIREYDEILPWDFIDIGVKKEYLIREHKKAINGELTKDCRLGCNNCGVNKFFESGECLDVKG